MVIRMFLHRIGDGYNIKWDLIFGNYPGCLVEVY